MSDGFQTGVLLKPECICQEELLFIRDTDQSNSAIEIDGDGGVITILKVMRPALQAITGYLRPTTHLLLKCVSDWVNRSNENGAFVPDCRLFRTAKTQEVRLFHLCISS